VFTARVHGRRFHRAAWNADAV